MESQIINIDFISHNYKRRKEIFSVDYNIPKLINNLKHSENWEKGELEAIVLMKCSDQQVMITAIHEGTEINSFQSNDSITFHIIEGQLEFKTIYQSVLLNKGQKLTLHENIDYWLSNNEDTVFIMTIAN